MSSSPQVALQSESNGTAPAPTRTPAEILENVANLADLLEEEAPLIEKEQHLTARAKQALVDAGAFSFAFPKTFGGPEMRLDDQVRLLEMIAYHSPSAAWNIMVLSDSGYFAPKMDPEFAKTLYANIDHATAGSTRPAGKAVPVEGGFRVSGRWSFGSGIRDADSLYGGFHKVLPDGGFELDPSGKPVLYQLFLPMDKVQIHDTWYTTGLSGSGSTEYSVDDVFVPDSANFDNFSGDGDLNLPPLSRHAGCMVVNEAGVPLGIAKRAIAEFKKMIEKPTRTNAFQSMKTQDPYVPAAYAEAVAYYDAARAYALSATSEMTDVLFSGKALSPAQNGQVMQITYMSGKLCRHALETILECIGARSVLATFPFERLYRDMSTITRHGNHRKKALEMAGVFALEMPWPAHMTE